MKKLVVLAISILFLSSCAHKLIGKNCEKTGSSEYFVCDSLGITGK